MLRKKLCSIDMIGLIGGVCEVSRALSAPTRLVKGLFEVCEKLKWLTGMVTEPGNVG